MVSNIVEISNLPNRNVPILSDKEAGEQYSRWSFLNIYSLSAVRDIYLITKDVEVKTKSKITEHINKLLLYKEVWEERKVLEYLNALVKFGLLNSNYEINTIAFENSTLNSEMSENDIENFRQIFFTYFRFKEISSWFISMESDFHRDFDNLKEIDFINASSPLYYYSDKNRFTDTFLLDLKNNNYKYTIDENMSHLMRFWDVYLKWGTTLKILDKFNLSTIGLKIEGEKDLSIVYFIRKFESFNLIDFIKQKFNSRYIAIPELILEIVKEYRFCVNDIKEFIIVEILNNDKLTFERTSQIFIIKGKESVKKIKEATYLYPQINDSYISNIILRK